MKKATFFLSATVIAAGAVADEDNVNDRDVIMPTNAHIRGFGSGSPPCLL